MKFQWNPLKYGDALGLTYGPLSGRAPGKLTDFGLDWQGKLNPGVSRTALDSANQIAPWVAAAIATFGGSTAGEAGEVAPAVGETGGTTGTSMMQRPMGMMGMGGKQQPYQPQTPMYDDNTGQNNNRDALVAALLQGRR